MANIQPCEWLHEAFEQLPLFAYPYQPECIPPNGLYFLYESREHCTIGGTDLPRITRVGTHVGQANLPDRLAQHYMLDERRMNFGSDHPKPADRSIFRKNVGRALLNQASDPYLAVWEIDFTKKTNRRQYAHLREIDKESAVEVAISAYIRSSISFRFMAVDRLEDRRRLEGRCIGALAYNPACRPSSNWLGNYSPLPKIREAGLWQVQHLANKKFDAYDRVQIETAIAGTLNWLHARRCR
jgi:hypothetical protein